jgi:hypothetical protein
LKSRPAPTMTLGNAAAAPVRPIVSCKACGHQVELDVTKMAERYGAETPVPEWDIGTVAGGRASREHTGRCTTRAVVMAGGDSGGCRGRFLRRSALLAYRSLALLPRLERSRPARQLPKTRCSERLRSGVLFHGRKWDQPGIFKKRGCANRFLGRPRSCAPLDALYCASAAVPVAPVTPRICAPAGIPTRTPAVGIPRSAPPEPNAGRDIDPDGRSVSAPPIRSAPPRVSIGRRQSKSDAER